MTTSVVILNHGPDSVSVAPIDDSGNPAENERQTVAPNGISRPIYVYANRNIHVAESKPLAAPTVADTLAQAQENVRPIVEAERKSEGRA